MSFYGQTNGSAILNDTWSSYVPINHSNYRLALIALVNFPFILILLNILWQLVRVLFSFIFLFGLKRKLGTFPSCDPTSRFPLAAYRRFCYPVWERSSQLLL
jgi:hypothetical protein